MRKKIGLGTPYISINPYNGETLKTFADITDAQLEAALASAQSCYLDWRLRSYQQRAVIIGKVANLMRAQVELLAKTITLDMGKQIGEARQEVLYSTSIPDCYAKNAERFLAPVKFN